MVSELIWSWDILCWETFSAAISLNAMDLIAYLIFFVLVSVFKILLDKYNKSKISWLYNKATAN